MTEKIFSGLEILGCVEDMNKETFKDFNSIRIFVSGMEVVNLASLELVVYNDEDQEDYVLYYDCSNCGNSYVESEYLKDSSCTCGNKLEASKVYDEVFEKETYDINK